MQVASAQTAPLSSTLFQTYNATSGIVGFGQCNESSPIALTSPGPTTPTGDKLTQLSEADAGNVISMHLSVTVVKLMRSHKTNYC